ncbi:transporter substrate-binding domain-containing protein [Chlorobaculum sp. 24CR]|nr:transporter substrate-binding domain-containing protein [Chlorobaculum sp. 24CR]
MLLLAYLFLSAPLGSLRAIAAENELVLATKQSPPFAMKNGMGEWEGISIDLVRAIANKEGRKLVIREMSFTGMLAAVERGEVDAAASAITVTADRERRLDFSFPYFQSGLAIAVREKETGWLHIIGRLFSPAFLRVLAALSLLLLISGVLVWLFERKKNPDHFGGTPAQGIWSGFWWAAVTMTTVGYGDKAPATLAGRLIALVWMFTGLVVISGFTAAMATVLTVGSLSSGITKVEDLYGKRVGTVKASSSSSYLENEAIRSTLFPSITDALHALENGKIEAVVFDEPIMRYLVTSGEIHGVTIIERVFRPEYYAVALPQGSRQREALNQDLLDLMASDKWKEIRFRYLHLKH